MAGLRRSSFTLLLPTGTSRYVLLHSLYLAVQHYIIMMDNMVCIKPSLAHALQTSQLQAHKIKKSPMWKA